ncbi:MAG: zinc-ribbon domain-containing protein [Ruminococcaceae bacterium]|nr:zinc-ribbon domain-containing protein [Oscillospiraceae bacterium]
MFCKSCGAPINQGETFCPACGTPVAAEQQPAYNTTPSYNAAPSYDTNSFGTSFGAPAYTPAPDNSILTFGILSLVFGSILGIIFGAIAGSKAKKYVAAGGVLSGGPKVGSILGKIGLILGIISSVVIAIYLVVYIVAIISLMGSSGYYYY